MSKEKQMTLEQKETMNIVIVGHVDHGKSTIIGRLMADTHSLPDGKLEQVKASCERNSKPFEYAFLLDALIDEQDQGITIDSARVFFKTHKRNYIIIDAPGHIEFLKNMISGAARAESALLVIDANEGVQENSRRHGYMLSMLGIKQIAVLVNKMDLVGYSQEKFNEIEKEYREFLKSINVEPFCFIPVSGMMGDNIAELSSNMLWYKEQTVLDVLDRFPKEAAPVDKPFRMPVQGVYKFTRFGDSRRIVAGTVNSGKLNVGDEVVFYPSGKKSKVKSIERFNAPAESSVNAGVATGFTLEEQIYITRGELAVRADELAPESGSRIRVSLFWLGREPMVKGKEYFFKLGTAKISARLDEITQIIDASTLSASPKEQVERHDVAECILSLNRAAAFDLAENVASTSRFVVVDDYEISGGGIIREALDDDQKWVRDQVFMRNFKWEKGQISCEDRAEKYNQKSALVLITGERNTGKKKLAKELEAKLFADGKIVYFLGIGNVLYGVDADIKGQEEKRKEHIRRLSEVAHILMDAGVILVVTAVGLTQSELEMIKTTVMPERIQTIWMGENISSDIAYDMQIDLKEMETRAAASEIKEKLREKNIIFKPW